MADKKISQLTAATTPLAGTEVLPIVQGGSTVKVAVSDLTTGRAISTLDITDTSLTASKPVFTDANKKLVSTGTLGTDQGGTGLTSFTDNGIAYATSSSALTTSANLQYNNSTGVFSSYITGSDSRLANFATTTFTTRGLRINSYTSVNGAADCGIEFDSGIGGYGGFTFSNSGTPLATIDDANSNLTVTLGNLVIGTSGKGIDFSATPGTGTSELLSDYEEGTWTPTFTSWTTAADVISATYTKIGRQVTVTMYATNGVNAYNQITGLPYTIGTGSAGSISCSNNSALFANCSALPGTTGLSGFNITMTGNYWQLSATYFT